MRPMVTKLTGKVASDESHKVTEPVDNVETSDHMTNKKPYISIYMRP